MLTDVFDQMPLFQDLNQAHTDVLRGYFIPLECHAGTVLFRQGDPAEYVYLVVAGEVSIRYKPEDGEDIHVTRVRAGGVVGWSALIGRRSYTSSAACSEFTQMLRVRCTDLQYLQEQYPEIGQIVRDRLAGVIAERIRGTHPQVVALLENGLWSSVR
jgi:CRP-like cAMP-binding protein